MWLVPWCKLVALNLFPYLFVHFGELIAERAVAPHTAERKSIHRIPSNIHAARPECGCTHALTWLDRALAPPVGGSVSPPASNERCREPSL